MTKHLSAALKAVDWTGNVQAFIDKAAEAQAVEDANLRTAIWAKQLESADHGNPALSFVREMQTAAQQVAVLIALGLYKASAASMRSMTEADLYYTYFRTHPAELATLVRDTKYFIGKYDVIEFHKLHTPRFRITQEKLGLLTRLDAWYSDVSAVVHGQIPGAWANHTAVGEIKNNHALQSQAVTKLVEGEDALHRLFLCTVGQALWDSFSSAAKKRLLAGLPGEQKAALGLDPA